MAALSGDTMSGFTATLTIGISAQGWDGEGQPRRLEDTKKTITFVPSCLRGDVYSFVFAAASDTPASAISFLSSAAVS
jgi:hypothetical protein